jgi:hypothetical protein
MRRPAVRSCDCLGSTLLPLLLILACFVLRLVCGERGHRARAAVPIEQEQRRARWEHCM